MIVFADHLTNEFLREDSSRLECPIQGFEKRIYQDGTTWHRVTPGLLAWLAMMIERALTMPTAEHNVHTCESKDYNCTLDLPSCKIMRMSALIGKSILFFNRLRELTGLEPGSTPEPPEKVDMRSYFSGEGFHLGESIRQWKIEGL